MTTYPSELLKLPFDQFSRQSRAADIIAALRKKGEKFRILDVGGYGGATKAFHPNDDVTVLDVFDVEEKDYIKGDATKMTFEDDSFDFVVSFDVFEHIPRELRNNFVSECKRVASRGVIIAAPVGTVTNTFAEKTVNELYKKLFAEDHRWLKEHIDYRLPEPGLSYELLKKNGLISIEFASNYTPLWVAMQESIFAASKFGTMSLKIDGLYQEYNELLPSDATSNTSENYRSISLGLKNEKDLLIVKNSMPAALDSEEYFKKHAEIYAKIVEVLVLSLNDMHNLEQVHNNTIDNLKTELKTEVDALTRSKKSLEVQYTDLGEAYRAIVNSKKYRYANGIACAINRVRAFGK